MSVIIFFPYRLTISWVDSSQSPASLSVMAFGLMVTYGLVLALNSRYALNSKNFYHQLLVFRCLCEILISEFWLACRWHKLTSSYLPCYKTAALQHRLFTIPCSLISFHLFQKPLKSCCKFRPTHFLLLFCIVLLTLSAVVFPLNVGERTLLSEFWRDVKYSR